ncbi:hypothetical protein BJ875DRAFT_483106 [Amylocarpus encephaloides]|uniref:Uncharacterized protein n=1 Tax=Amylocarpus encephaloides TaxID=45428 RepID=A0A9P7YL15_9HELO|nr:hypothetical protein BJ875DRAFT_483106 [Amylocarpus encephaloides]
MSSSDNSEDHRIPFLGKDDKECEMYAKLPPNQRSSSWFLPIIALLSIVAHSLLLLLWMKPSEMPESFLRPQNLSRLYSPFHNAIKTQVEIWADDAWDNSVYTGNPRKELDDAWNKLVLVEGISVTTEEAASLNLKSKIKLESGNQAAIMGYFHNLHCIDFIQTYIHERGIPHILDFIILANHCIEVLRRSVLCQPDLSVHAIHWQDEKRRGMTLESNSTRECVNFDAVNDFALTRRFRRHEIVGEKADLHKPT